MRIEPLANRVICTLIEESKELKSGLVIPDIAHRHKGIAYGEVIAVGPGRLNSEGKLIAVHVSVGDIVMFPRAAPAVLPLEDDEGNETEVLMLPENDIIAKVHGLRRASMLTDIAGNPFTLTGLNPQSTALPDVVYQNRDELDRSVSDLKQVGAPPDVIADVAQSTDQAPHEPDATEH